MVISMEGNCWGFILIFKKFTWVVAPSKATPKESSCGFREQADYSQCILEVNSKGLGDELDRGWGRVKGAPRLSLEVLGVEG